MRKRAHAALRFVSESTVRCLLRLVLGRLAWVTAAGEGTVPDHHRCVDSKAGLRCQEFLDSPVDVGGCWAVKKFPAPRSARAAIWAHSGLAPGSPAPGSCCGGRPGTLIGGSRRSVSGQRRSRGCISAVRRPLCQVYALTGASRRSRLAASRSHAGNDVKEAGGSGLEVAAVAADPGHAGKFGVVKANERKPAKR